MNIKPMLAALGLGLLAPAVQTYAASPTEGVITHDFVSEAAMQADLLQMLANFSKYMVNDWQSVATPNSAGEQCGCFKGESTMNSNEQGVRPNADLSMICAFLAKYGKDKVQLPEGVTWDKIEDMARQSLVFAYSTHKANKLKLCADNRYWGSTSRTDNVWESSLWAMSVAYSAFFQWDKLSDTQKKYIENLLVAECRYELERTIPTGYSGDTKAEENGWEADVLAAALGLFPNHADAPKWFDRMREFAVNSYSHPSDAANNTVIDPHYDSKTVADLYRGQNLYDDYTLQNHSFFHTSYQNVVMQELGEAALALKLFQTSLYGTEKWRSNALMHNNDRVMNDVLAWLALADGELAMPNGNDWSLFLFDQITSYTTMACMASHPDALMLENMAYKNIKARQTTTSDGSWLLRADVGARRMGVQAHRVMMTWLMHHVCSTAALTPSTWADFNRRHADARLFESQNVVRAASDSRFSCFSWSAGKKSYTGYIASTAPDKNKIIIPYRANDTGNFLGWYDVEGRTANATPVVSGRYALRGNAYIMNGELNTNSGALNHRFVIYSTPGNPVIYLDQVRANSGVTITGAHGGLMAISVDEFTQTSRNIAAADRQISTNGNAIQRFATNWACIDDEVGFVSTSTNQMAFGYRSTNNSINMARFEPLHSSERRAVQAGSTVDTRNAIYYSRCNAQTTKAMADATTPLAAILPEGYNGIIVPDTDGTRYILLANFNCNAATSVQELSVDGRTPVLAGANTLFADGKAALELKLAPNRALGQAMRIFVDNAPAGITVCGDPENDFGLYLRNSGNTTATVALSGLNTDGTPLTREITVAPGQSLYADVISGQNYETEYPDGAADNPARGYTDITASTLVNANFEEDTTYGATGSVTLGGVTYNPCYVNDVPAADSRFPNVLPVQGWEPGATLGASSNYARMYSMPYSSNMYVCSPSNVGNYTALCPKPFGFEGIGDRVLTALNSWTSGDNRISQTVTLEPGDYRLLINAWYDCPNQSASDGTTVSASGNVNTSLTGVSVGGNTDYRYPAARSEWETMVYDFKLTEQSPVQISLGYNTSAAVGVANNTLMYIDGVRLLRKDSESISNVENISDNDPNALVNVVNAAGITVRTAVPRGEALRTLPAGFYIVGGKKQIVKP